MQIWNMTLRAGNSRDDSGNYKNGLFKTRFNSQRDSLSWQNDIALNADQLLMAGLDYQNDRVASTTLYTRLARSNRVLFGQYQGSFAAHSLQASVRRDDNPQFGGHHTGGLGYGYALDEATRLTVSYGTAFKVPTFNQLYYPGFGSAPLRAEYRVAADWQLQGRIDNLLDKRYETAQFFNQARRGWYVTLNYQPKK